MCAICGESTYKFLCLDHIDGGGMKHRQENQQVRGCSVYQWCKMNNYPPIFRVLCYNCNYLVIPRPEYALNKKAERSRNRSKRIKLEVFMHYSNNELKCALCGKNDYRVLTIDHINGGGRQHMKEIGLDGSYGFYIYLRKHNFPEGYQILCMNCNCSKHIK